MGTSPGAGLALGLDRLLGAQAKLLAKHLELSTAGELLNYFPRTYLKRGELTPIADVPVEEEVTLIARVQTANSRRMHTRRGMLLEVVITDDADGRLGGMNLTFFNGYTAMKELRPGVRAMFSGKATVYREKLTLTNPQYVILDDAPADSVLVDQPIPVYPATEKLSSDRISLAVGIVLDTLDPQELSDPIPEAILQRDHLMSLAQAYESIHRPVVVEEAYRARHRFRYQEAFVLQTSLARRRALTAREPATARPPVRGGLRERFDAGLPFTLTAGQLEVGEVLAGDLGASHPMNQLLQGEVGSGKTIVALRAMLQVVDAGGQAALLAPTEVLAAQHHQSITATLGPLADAGMLGADPAATRVVLLTGSLTTSQRRKAMLELTTGEAGIVIGTHALLSENVTFFDLGLIVVDEQHRFGVEQRDALRAKAAASPHVLVMTATPIPRTVAMTVFGDLDVSTLTELPAGRKSITTHEVGLCEHPVWIDRVWARAREEVDAGRQVYVVCPKIGASDEPVPQLEEVPGRTSELTSVLELHDALLQEPHLQGLQIGMLHGRMDPQEKTASMAHFAAGGTQVLVATTVIEVGVDVANATLMVVMDAERFGISQLHQLRGRVGRGAEAGTCLLVTRMEPEHPSRERLAAVAATTDGFVLSQKDLEFRREGDILGSSQSGGKSALRLLKVSEHGDLIEAARRDAQEIVALDPELAGSPALAAALDLYLNPEKEAFLERG